MKIQLGWPELVVSTSATLVAFAQPVWAAQTEVTNVQLQTSQDGITLVLNTQGNNRPPIFTVSRGRSTVVDIDDTQLRLTGSNTFEQANPVPGITSVTVQQFDADTVRVTVNGAAQAPAAQVIRQDGSERLGLSFKLVESLSESPQAPAPLPPPTGQRPNAVPPFRPRAVAPPVGDIAVAPLDVSPDQIRLNSDTIIPRLLLREAPVREVLTLLARAAGVNVVFAEGEAGGAADQEGTAATTGGVPPISLDIENESVQDVFNYVLQVSGLQANRVGNTVFIGQNLPGIAQNRVVRTLRLNQIKATASGTIVQTLTTEAETGGSIGGDIGTGGGFTGTTSTATANTAIQRRKVISENIQNQGAKEILQSYGANGGEGTEGGGSSATLLRGLEVVADARANAVTLIGTPRLVEIASTLLTQLDIRRRQVAINVKLVDVNLLKEKNANADLLFNSGIGVGRSVTASFTATGFQIGAALGRDFLLNLFGSIENNDSKILTNPTLLIQEGSSAQVNLTQEIFSGFIREEERDSETGQVTVTIEPIIRPSGVIFNVSVDRIDDNGFITLNLSPEVSAPSGTFEIEGGTTGTLLQQRRLETGQVRLRDGQTLILTGIIQDEDRIELSKVPILGDIPILGRLFRREERSRNRSELVVLVTPKILSDSEQSSFGYEYTPSPEVENLLNR